ncbi:MAG: hypothetical protein CSA62_05815 [Planctomycetota bacterium]|nr:MAG: hypothetical protein CSA62_05815 [Planctomycetota bacterium]
MPSSSAILRPLALLAALLLLGLSACSSRGESAAKDPSIEKQFSETEKMRQEQKAREQQTGFLLKRFDDALNAYHHNLQLGSGQDIATKVESVRQLLEQEALRFQSQLLGFLRDEEARPRWIAAAALGFSGDPKVMEALVVMLKDPVARVRESAALGLGQLAVPYTPLDALEERLFDPREELPVQRSVAWCLVRLQLAKAPAEPFRRIWPELLAGNLFRKDEILSLHGLHGLGLVGEQRFAAEAKRYLAHPRALLRQSALIALARCGTRENASDILPFLSQAESAPNVRLTARKALKHLTGNRVDHGFDLGAWRAEFGLVEQEQKDG